MVRPSQDYGEGQWKKGEKSQDEGPWKKGEKGEKWQQDDAEGEWMKGEKWQDEAEGRELAEEAESGIDSP